ncbi:hypothetical protein P872_18045 [Rhodonellum psychrophilum GCM71 = DSM 17998]|uniref:Uncharacterized protein n=1 Tax=Rhodonellum psychrophilum GCM71 = DSM 17998 TaxID=1123057 RepID=U5BPD1_9BACT|nr:hypothetical protein P872_18045 [Rhodonellum psychrophilum GCM71 = DSM 17998]
MFFKSEGSDSVLRIFFLNSSDSLSFGNFIALSKSDQT